jgi:hypothetical protein
MGRVLGPFSEKPISTLRISPIGLVEKPDNGWRLITHLSYPNQFSVNHFIYKDVCAVKYTSFDSVMDMISELRKSAKIAKLDISQAFRLLIVNPAEFDLLGIMFEGKFYIDKCLPMGCAISCPLFEKFSTFLHWLVQIKSGINTLDHYLDDFIFAGEALANDCEILMNTFLKISEELGVPIAENKAVHQTTVLTFLGLEIDTVLMVVRILSCKLLKLKSYIEDILIRRKIKNRLLESAVGLQSLCARAIQSVMAFSRRFYDLLSSVKVKKKKLFNKNYTGG